MSRRRSDTQHSLGALVLAVLALVAGIAVVVESAWARRLPPAPAAEPVGEVLPALTVADLARHVAEGAAQLSRC
ncbi:hypothetical protein [Chelatococcus composti]|jgi:hypothetical protein|uniref:Uncharacterized protein n=1 Tax=Chelatococcus composti TaxID=1743235 RepID=A0A841KBA6_9HYPH|nr:hypothetical protein [Chelatococcus composti]MBB6168164.1 hypothetical protein [Chelatococcus composti]MBS7736748.1 hypothetical protein [Chelatococcus composti]GGG37923.1 hypothetical protein GCM10008026_18500 [Chelatococcus composti]